MHLNHIIAKPENKHFMMQILYICPTNQHTDEPQVCFVVFIEPGSISMKSMADEEYHGVVCADDQEEENQCGNHNPLVQHKNSRKTHI